jgi:hypothetical protein
MTKIEEIYTELMGLLQKGKNDCENFMNYLASVRDQVE